jgi:hypothetical protein
MTTINPYGLNVQEWTDFTALGLYNYGAAPVLLDPDNWREWALTVLGFPAISDINAPDPTSFEDWREWASRFNQLYSRL